MVKVTYIVMLVACCVAYPMARIPGDQMFVRCHVMKTNMKKSWEVFSQLVEWVRQLKGR